MPAQYSLPAILVAGIIGLFGLLVKVITRILDTSDKAVKEANDRADKATVAANEMIARERSRYDTLMDRVVGTVERLDENVDGFYTILDGHLRYVREIMSDLLDVSSEPPPSRPPAGRPSRPRRIGGD